MISRRHILQSTAGVTAAATALAQTPPSKGNVTKYAYKSTKNFPGSTYDYWVYVPGHPAPPTGYALMVLFDGGGFVNETGRFKAAEVFDKLIAAGEMPPSVGLFINPGVTPPMDPNTQMGRFNRSYEYDSLGDRNAKFLIEEILPELAKLHKITEDPNLHGIGGSSSGAIAAFTVAWNRPNTFRRVLSYIGSYVNLRGGDNYANIVRMTEPKPLRVFLQDGSGDLNIFAGNWWLANQALSSALEYAGYESTFVKGTDGHNSNHQSRIFTESLQWLWANWKQPIVASKGTGKSERHFATEFLDPAHDWEEMSKGHGFTEGPAVDKDGNVYFTDVRADKIHKIDHASGNVSLFKDQSGGANGLMFGSDGRLYACQNKKRQIIAIHADGSEDVLATDVASNDLVVNAKNEVWWTDPPGHRIWFTDGKGTKRVVHEGLEFPNGIILSPDQGMLMCVDSRSRWVWSFQVQPDGSLANGEAFYHLETWDNDSQSQGDGLTMDTDGHLYVATRLGIQICDQPGRVVAILNNPQLMQPSNCCFGGPNLDYLYTTNREKVFRRKLHRKGLRSWPPLKPARPSL